MTEINLKQFMADVNESCESNTVMEVQNEFEEEMRGLKEDIRTQSETMGVLKKSGEMNQRATSTLFKKVNDLQVEWNERIEQLSRRMSAAEDSDEENESNESTEIAPEEAAEIRSEPFTPNEIKNLKTFIYLNGPFPPPKADKYARENYFCFLVVVCCSIFCVLASTGCMSETSKLNEGLRQVQIDVNWVNYTVMEMKMKLAEEVKVDNRTQNDTMPRVVLFENDDKFLVGEYVITWEAVFATMRMQEENEMKKLDENTTHVKQPLKLKKLVRPALTHDFWLEKWTVFIVCVIGGLSICLAFCSSPTRLSAR